MREQTWNDLAPAQADGLACVICARDYLRQPTQRIPVGRSHTGSQVFACAAGCAEAGRAGVCIPDDALTAAGAAFLAALERATAATPTKDPRHAYPDDVVAVTVQAAAPLIVAAEVRRLAQQIEGDVVTAQRLRDRADQLDPAGRGELR